MPHIIVVGAGHAGCEAALAAARMGATVTLFTLSLDAVANLPCNPSVGGTGKGHLVYEIDALGGEMGFAADVAAIQSRTLNTGKGAAVRSKRVQADRTRYISHMKSVLENTPGLTLRQGEVTAIHTEDTPAGRIVRGVSVSPGGKFSADAVILSTGTYLAGVTHVGAVKRASGPDNSLPAAALSASLAEAGIPLLRFKTGTPPRIHRRSIDFSKLEIQNGDGTVIPFSRRTDPEELNARPQIPCYVTYTTAETHRIIRENLHLSPLFSGQIQGTGPRYCPSIEDKVVRFADKERHQLFIEPMGLSTEEIYLQGFSSSLPAEVQEKMVRSLPGFEKAEILRYAYAIEYDCCDPLCLYPTLETKAVQNLYGAGQFNGSSGYEEAAAQGLVAGANAVLKLRGEAPLAINRTNSYVGVLIDDLTVKGTNEPYRMMTSRSEFRLSLRQDNAEERLLPEAFRAGLVCEERYRAFLARTARIEAEIRRLGRVHVGNTAAVNALLEGLGTAPLQSGASLAELIRRPEITYDATAPLDGDRPSLELRDREAVQTKIKYEGYIKKSEDAVRRQEKMESVRLPSSLDYLGVAGLRTEAAQKLQKLRPTTLGQAARISGVNPADISVLMIYLSQHRNPEDKT